jgi:hypothetical protein
VFGYLPSATQVKVACPLALSIKWDDSNCTIVAVRICNTIRCNYLVRNINLGNQELTQGKLEIFE